MRGGSCPAKPSWTASAGRNSRRSTAALMCILRASALPLRMTPNIRAGSLRCVALAMCSPSIRTTSGRGNAPALPADLPGFSGHSVALRHARDAGIPAAPPASAGAPPLDGMGAVLSELLPRPERPVHELQAAVEHL